MRNRTTNNRYIRQRFILYHTLECAIGTELPICALLPDILYHTLELRNRNDVLHFFTDYRYTLPYFRMRNRNVKCGDILNVDILYHTLECAIGTSPHEKFANAFILYHTLECAIGTDLRESGAIEHILYHTLECAIGTTEI